MDDLPNLGHSIPPADRPLAGKKAVLRFGDGHKGVFLPSRLDVRDGRGEAAARTPRSNCIPGGEPRINVDLKVQRLALVGFLHGDDFDEKLIVNVLREAIFSDQFGAGAWATMIFYDEEWGGGSWPWLPANTNSLRTGELISGWLTCRAVP